MDLFISFLIEKFMLIFLLNIDNIFPNATCLIKPPFLFPCFCSMWTLIWMSWIPLVHHGAQCRLVVYNVVLYHWSYAQRRSHKPRQTDRWMLPHVPYLSDLVDKNYPVIFWAVYTSSVRKWLQSTQKFHTPERK